MARGQALVRVLTLLRRLEGGGRYGLQQLARDLHVHERTVRRDLQALEAAGVPIRYSSPHETGEAAQWWLVKR